MHAKQIDKPWNKKTKRRKIALIVLFCVAVFFFSPVNDISYRRS